MRLSAAAKAAANAVSQNVIARKPHASFGAAIPITKVVASDRSTTTPRPAPFLSFKYEAHPKPINCASFLATQEFATDRSHPLHIQTKRRLAAFDPTLFHWSVRVPTALSKKAIVRNWAVKRVRTAFRAVLKDGGWDEKGNTVGTRARLSGALCIFISKNATVIEAGGEDVKKECAWLLEKVVGQHDRARRNGNPRRRDIRKIRGAAEGKWEGRVRKIDAMTRPVFD